MTKCLFYCSPNPIFAMKFSTNTTESDTPGHYPAPRLQTLFMLNSAEHEIFPANKSQITNNCKFFSAKCG